MSKDRNVPFIYESPDKGETIYRRRFGDRTNRELIKSKEEPKMTDEKWERIQEHCRQLSKEMLEWERQEHESWGPPWNDPKSQLPKGESEKCFYQLHP